MQEYLDDLFDSEYIQTLFGNDTMYLVKTIVSCFYAGVVIGLKKDRTHPFVFWNKRATEILGVGATDAATSQWAEVYNLKDPITQLPLPENEIPLVMAFNGKSVHNKILLVKNTYISCNAKPLVKDNEVVGGVVMFHDVTTDFGEKLQLQEKILQLTTLNNDIRNTLNQKD